MTQRFSEASNHLAPVPTKSKANRTILWFCSLAFHIDSGLTVAGVTFGSQHLGNCNILSRCLWAIGGWVKPFISPFDRSDSKRLSTNSGCIISIHSDEVTLQHRCTKLIKWILKTSKNMMSLGKLFSFQTWGNTVQGIHLFNFRVETVPCLGRVKAIKSIGGFGIRKFGPGKWPKSKINKWAMKKYLVVQGIILPSNMGIIINHYKDPY